MIIPTLWEYKGEFSGLKAEGYLGKDTKLQKFLLCIGHFLTSYRYIARFQSVFINNKEIKWDLSQSKKCH